jgi:hypothetical protein
MTQNARLLDQDSGDRNHHRGWSVGIALLIGGEEPGGEESAYVRAHARRYRELEKYRRCDRSTPKSIP